MPIPNKDEIWHAVRQLGSQKALGLNGLNVLFYKKHWCIVKRDIVAMVQNVFHTSFILCEINHSNIALIPKIEKPNALSHYKPISLCNISYIILSEMITNRLCCMMSSIISPMQVAFIPGRLIQENSTIAHEIFYTMNTRCREVGQMAIKVDMECTYDKMEWTFLCSIL